MLTQKQIDSDVKKCEKRGHHNWKRRGKTFERCVDCGTQRIEKADASVVIEPLKI